LVNLSGGFSENCHEIVTFSTIFAGKAERSRVHALMAKGDKGLAAAPPGAALKSLEILILD
jgi:hypothetical protein